MATARVACGAPSAGISIATLSFGDIAPARLSALILKVWRPGDLIIISSDLSHYHGYDEARAIDDRELDPGGTFRDTMRVNLALEIRFPCAACQSPSELWQSR